MGSPLTHSPTECAKKRAGVIDLPDIGFEVRRLGNYQFFGILFGIPFVLLAVKFKRMQKYRDMHRCVLIFSHRTLFTFNRSILSFQVHYKYFHSFIAATMNK